MSNIFHELGKTVNEKISGLLDTLKSSTNTWVGDNTFLKSLNIGSDISNENSVDLNVGTETTPQDINAFGEIKVDGQQNLGNLEDFTTALGLVANNGMASQIANLEARLHKLRTFYPDARPEFGEEIGEMIFDLEKSVILVWNGVEWLELGGKVPVTLKVFAEGEGTVTGAGEYSKGEDVYITATPRPNYGFKEWTGPGVLAGMVQSPNSAGTFINMTQSWMVTAKFGLVDHLLLVTVSGGGSVEGNNTEWQHGTKATIKAIPGPNSDFIEWTGGVDNPYELETTITMTGPKEVEAVFSLKNYLLTLIADGGTATTTSGTYSFEHGSIAEITATPDSIHNFTNWSGDGIVSDPNTATATVEMTEARTITANFSLKEYQLQVQAGTGGTASGSGIFEHFETASITATPDDANGYEFDNWTGDVQTADSATTTVYITGETVVVANFKLKDYALTIQTNDMSNEAPGGGTTTGGGVKQHGEVVSITATPDPEYQFHNWTNTTGNPVGDDPFNTDNTYTMDGPFTIVANFKYKEYALTVNAGTGGTASAPDGAIVSHFDQAQIVAVPDDANGYEFNGWTKDSGDGNIASTSAEDTTVEILSNTEVTANFKLKDYIVYTGAKFKGKISLDGYYPLYVTANEANADPDGDGTHHSHDINGVTYYMPNGLPASEQYHGTHSFPWGTFGLYDEENPGDPDAPIGSWGTPPITKQHGTNGWYYANPAQYHVYDSIEADSRNTLPFLDASAPAGPIQINNNLNYIANFSLLQYSLNIMHYPTGEWVPNTLSPASAYWGDIEINGDNTQTDSGSGSQQEFPGLIADGVWTDTNVSQLYWTGDFDAFSQQTIKAIPKASYGFIEWVEPAGQNLVADRESAETTVTITPQGTNTGNQVELAARFGLLPISTFLTSGDLYFGETLTFTDVSTAPSGDGNIVSAEFSNDSGISFGSAGKRLRTYQQRTNSAPYVEIQTVNGSSTYDYGDFSDKEWTILIDSEKIGSIPTDARAAVFNKDDHRWYIRNYNANAMTHYTRTDAGDVYSGNIGIKLTGRFGMSCTATTQTVWANNGSKTGNKSGHSAPLDSSKLLRLFSGYPEYEGNLTDNHLSFPALTERIIFIPRAITIAEFQEFYAGTPVQDLSFYSDIEDYINAGTGTYPSLNGELGNITARLVDGSESHFKTIASLTLPSGSAGDTTGSVDVTLTVTDDQGLTDTETQNIIYGPAPLDPPELESYNKYVQTGDGLYILGSPGVLEVETEVNDGGVTLTETYL